MKADRSLLVQILIGLFPVTCLLVPFLAAGGAGLMLSVLSTLAESERSVSERFHDALPALGLIAWTLSAMAGVFAVWGLVLASAGRGLDRAARGVLACCLALGFAAEVRWLQVMLRHAEAYDFATWAVWLGLLLPPSLLGFIHLDELFHPRRVASR